VSAHAFGSHFPDLSEHVSAPAGFEGQSASLEHRGAHTVPPQAPATQTFDAPPSPQSASALHWRGGAAPPQMGSSSRAQ
jgi:hypothetical protein